MQNKYSKYALLLILLVFSCHSYAASSVGDISFYDNLKSSFDSLTNSINAFAASYNAKVMPIGLTLFGGLSVIAVAWSGLQLAMASGSLSESMNRLMTTVFMVAFASFILSPTGYNMMFVNGVDGLMNQLAALASPSGDASISNAFTNFLYAEFGIVDKVIAQFSGQGLSGFLTGGFLVILLFFLFIAFLITSVVGMIAALTALVTVAIALALGPVFIPFIVLEKTSFLFDGWVKFLINACLTKVIIAMLLAVGIVAIEGISSHFAAGASVGSAVGLLLGSLAVSGVVGQMMLSSPAIAGAITSGGALSNAGFAGSMHKGAGLMTRNASVMASQKAAGGLSGGNKISSVLKAGLSRSGSSGNINSLPKPKVPEVIVPKPTAP